MAKCNNTLEDITIHEKDLSIGITFHHLGLLISAASGLVAIAIAGWLLIQHARHYSKPEEQKHIIRILFMIPVYAAVSFLSYYNYLHTIYYQVLRDCYEAFAIASFFSLLCAYLAPDLHEQKEYFRGIRDLRNWLWPLTWVQKCTGGRERGWLRVPLSGLTWFNIVWVSVFQYCFIRVFFTIVSVIAQATDRYCVESLSPAFAHIWVTVFEASSVTIAMYGLIQFYMQTRRDLAEYRPFLKILCIKLVIFFSFWQTLVISFLVSAHGPLQPTEYISYPDMSIGIPSMLLCLEMAMFAVLHLFAFPWRPYRVGETLDDGKYAGPGSSTRHYQGGSFGLKAIADAFNPWDIIKASARGFRWLFVGARYRHQDKSYQRNGDGFPAQNTGDEYYPDNGIPLKAQPRDQAGAASYGLAAPKDALYDGTEGYSNVPNASHPAHPSYSDRTELDASAPGYPRGWPLAMPSAHVHDQEETAYRSTAVAGPAELDDHRGGGSRYSFDRAAEDRAGLLRHAQETGQYGRT